MRGREGVPTGPAPPPEDSRRVNGRPIATERRDSLVFPSVLVLLRPPLPHPLRLQLWQIAAFLLGITSTAVCGVSAVFACTWDNLVERKKKLNKTRAIDIQTNCHKTAISIQSRLTRQGRFCLPPLPPPNPCKH